MLKQKSFVKLSGKKGKLSKVVKEHYLRDDIPCGFKGCTKCSSMYADTLSLPLSPSPSTTTTLLDPEQQLKGTIKWKSNPSFVIVPDTNIILHHWDTLLQRYNNDFSFFPDIIILQIVLQEVKARNEALYKMVRAKISNPPPNQRFFVFSNEHHKDTYPPPLTNNSNNNNDANGNNNTTSTGSSSITNETPNDRNDRAIRIATCWYRQHIKDIHPTLPIVLLSNDRLNRLLSVKESERDVSDSTAQELLCFSLSHFCSSLQGEPSGPLSLLKDQTSPPIHFNSTTTTSSTTTLPKDLQSTLDYADYLQEDFLESGIRSGRLLIGKLCITERTNVARHSMATVALRNRKSGKITTVTLSSHLQINRAIHGDQVVCQAVVMPPSSLSSAAIVNDPLISTSTHDAELRSREDELNSVVDDDGIVADDGVVDDSIIDDNDDDKQQKQKQQQQYQVVGVRKRGVRAFCGSLLPKTIRDGLALFMCLDSRIPLVLLRVGQNGPALKSRRLQVRIASWDAGSRYPVGHIVGDLGEAGLREVEGRMILLEHQIQNEPWSPAVLKDLPSPDWTVRADCLDLSQREDFTHLALVSVDPPGCTDIDDALHARYLPSGAIEVGVHIADVTAFVRAESEMDLEAQRRGTTVYMVDDRIDMLPSLLGSNLCSLQEHKERLAFSVIWTLSGSACDCGSGCVVGCSIVNDDDKTKTTKTTKRKVLQTRFHRSVIKSRSSFTYAAAQGILDGVQEAPSQEVKESLQILLALSKEMRQARMEEGSLSLSSVELRFKLDEAKMPLELEVKEPLPTNHMVEEWMLAANCAVAKRIEEYFPSTAILRRHPSPSPSSFVKINEMLKRRGLEELLLDSSKTLNASLDGCQIEGDPLFNKVVRCLVTRSMYQAKYFSSGTVDSSEYWHYGLACPIYTHFTSPIRRYADVMVHRLLGAILVLDGSSGVSNDNSTMEIDSLPPRSQQPPPSPSSSSPTNLGIYWDTQGLDDICGNLNYRHTMAQHAQRSSTEVYTHLFLKGKGESVEDAYMIGVEDAGIIRVLLPKYGIENEIEVDSSIFSINVDNQFLLNKRNNEKIRLFDSMKVSIRVDQVEDSAHRERISLKMLL